MESLDILLDDGIYIAKEDMPSGFYRMLMGSYHFTKRGFNEDEKLSIFENVTRDGHKYIKLPPTFSYFKNFLEKNNLKLGEVIDTRVAPPIDEINLDMELREHQVPIMKGLEKFDFEALITAKTGFGKAQPLSEPILTPNGWKTMGDIKVGDFVIGSDGDKTQVLGVFPQGIRDIYKVEFIDGTFVYCDKEHLWTVYNRNNKKKTLSVSEMLDTWINKRVFDKRYDTDRNEYNYSIDLAPSLNFSSNKELKLHPYLLGLLLGDGGLSGGSIKFTNSDINIINKLEELLPEEDCIGRRYFRKGAWNIRIKRKIFQQGEKSKTAQILEGLGLLYKKSIEKHIPEEYLFSSKENRELLYKGLIDTDGYINTETGRLEEYSTSSRQLAQDFLQLGRSLGKFLSMKERVPKYVYKGERKEGQISYRIREKTTPRKSIINISYSHKEEAQCIKVEAEDSLYITRGYNLTHNTSLALYIAKHLKTPMLFIASRTSLLGNMKKDCQQFNVAEEDMVEINSEWLKNPVIKPIMFCVTNTLCNENIQKELYNKVGLLVCDEIHLAFSGKETRNAIYSVNPKHRLYLSATPKLAFDGLAEASLSMNEVTSEEIINFKINVSNIELVPSLSLLEQYYKDESYNLKKEALFSNMKFMENVAEMVAYNVLKNKRVSLIYLEHTSGQELLKDLLQDYGLKVAVINTNTKKKEQTYIIENFDKLDYDVVISGSSISAGVSFYKLSTIFNINITLNENNLTQLVGRLKRKDDKICAKSKEYIQITLERISDRKWVNDKRVLKKFEYIEWNEVVKVDFNESLISGLDKIIKD